MSTIICSHVSIFPVDKWTVHGEGLFNANCGRIPLCISVDEHFMEMHSASYEAVPLLTLETVDMTVTITAPGDSAAFLSEESGHHVITIISPHCSDYFEIVTRSCDVTILNDVGKSFRELGLSSSIVARWFGLGGGDSRDYRLAKHRAEFMLGREMPPVPSKEVIPIVRNLFESGGGGTVGGKKRSDHGWSDDEDEVKADFIPDGKPEVAAECDSVGDLSSASSLSKGSCSQNEVVRAVVESGALSAYTRVPKLTLHPVVREKDGKKIPPGTPSINGTRIILSRKDRTLLISFENVDDNKVTNPGLGISSVKKKASHISNMSCVEWDYSNVDRSEEVMFHDVTVLWLEKASEMFGYDISALSW